MLQKLLLNVINHRALLRRRFITWFIYRPLPRPLSSQRIYELLPGTLHPTPPYPTPPSADTLFAHLLFDHLTPVAHLLRDLLLEWRGHCLLDLDLILPYLLPYLLPHLLPHPCHLPLWPEAGLPFHRGRPHHGRLWQPRGSSEQGVAEATIQKIRLIHWIVARAHPTQGARGSVVPSAAATAAANNCRGRPFGCGVCGGCGWCGVGVLIVCGACRVFLRSNCLVHRISQRAVRQCLDGSGGSATSMTLASGL